MPATSKSLITKFCSVTLLASLAWIPINKITFECKDKYIKYINLPWCEDNPIIPLWILIFSMIDIAPKCVGPTPSKNGALLISITEKNRCCI